MESLAPNRNPLLGIALATALLFGSRAAVSADAATIKMRSDDILFAGDITKANVANFISLYEAQERKPTLVTVRSPGGSADAGMQFGEFIFNHGLDVRILNYCFSSCANYVFTAGKTKYITKHAVIGWHGSAISQDFSINGKGDLHVDCRSDADCAEELARAIVDVSVDCTAVTNCDEARPKLIATFKATFDSLLKRQRAFFEMTGVDERVTIYGQEIRCNCSWTFSVDDMRRFNIRNIKDNQPGHFLESSLAEVREQGKIKRSTKLLKLPKR